MKPGEVWKLGLPGDPSPWHYLVVEADGDGVDMVLLDAAGEPNVEPGDVVGFSWDDIRGRPGHEVLLWELVV